MTSQCPDCNSLWTPPNELTHDDTCPLYVGLQRATAADARWFAAHPGKPRRYRRTTTAERSETRLLYPGAPVDTFVTVRRLAAGAHQHTYPSGRSELQYTGQPAVDPARRGGAR